MKKRKIKFVIIFSVFFFMAFFSRVYALTYQIFPVNVDVVSNSNSSAKPLNQKTFFGNRNHIDALSAEDEVFCFFTQDNIVVSYEEKYLFRMSHSNNFTAYFKNKDKFYVAFLDANDKVISFEEVNAGEDALIPLPPADFGIYSFSHWSKESTNIIEDTVIKAVYKKEVIKHNLKVDINGIITNEDVNFGSVRKIESDLEIGDLKFSHWLIDDTIISYENQIVLSIIKDTNLKAIYKTNGTSTKEAITFLHKEVIKTNDVLTFVGKTSIDGNYIETGIIYANLSEEDDFNIFNENIVKVKALKISPNHEFAIRIKEPDYDIMVSSYVIIHYVQNNENKYEVIYSAPVFIKADKE